MFKRTLLSLVLLSLTFAPALSQQFPDPCQSNAKTSVPINQVTSTTLFSGATARKNYICSVVIVGSDAESTSLIEGTGSTCVASPLALIGAATAASGLSLPANGGITLGNGSATVAKGSNANFSVCLLQSGTGRIGGVLTYVQQ